MKSTSYISKLNILSSYPYAILAGKGSKQIGYRLLLFVSIHFPQHLFPFSRRQQRYFVHIGYSDFRIAA